MSVTRPPFARTDSYANAHDLSLRLIALVAIDLQRREKFRPTQGSIAKAIGVSQSMVHQVLYKGKSFGEARFENYAESQERYGSPEKLLEALLGIQVESSLLDSLRQVKRNPESPPDLVRALFNLYETVHGKLEQERRYSKVPSLGRAFDSYKAYSEVLSFAVEALDMINDGASAVGVLTQEGNRSRAIWMTESETGVQTVSRHLDGDPILEWLTHHLTDSARGVLDGPARSIETRIPVSSIPVPAKDRSALLASPFVTDFCLSVQNVLSDSTEETATWISFVTLFPESDRHPSDLRDTALSCVRHLVEKVASYAIEDSLRCVEVMMNSRLSFGECLLADFERAEHHVSSLLHSICESESFSSDVATSDVWVYYLSEKAFVSPSEGFRRVANHNANLKIDHEQQRIALARVFNDEFSRGRLQPRPLGKTRHMIGNRRALVINKSDNLLGSKFWSSSHSLEVGTFIGIPMIFKPSGPGGVSFLSALYIRFIRDLTTEDARDVINRVIGIMELTHPGIFDPLMQLASGTNDRQLEVQQFQDSERGIWYEVAGSHCCDQIGESARSLCRETEQ